MTCPTALNNITSSKLMGLLVTCVPRIYEYKEERIKPDKLENTPIFSNSNVNELPSGEE
jgi:hypothetical protein